MKDKTLKVIIALIIGVACFSLFSISVAQNVKPAIGSSNEKVAL